MVIFSYFYLSLFFNKLQFEEKNHIRKPVKFMLDLNLDFLIFIPIFLSYYAHHLQKSPINASRIVKK